MGIENWLRRFKPWQVVAVAALVLGVGLVAVALATPDSYTAQVDDCEELVTAQLRSPTTAEFTTASVEASGEYVVIAGAVDSQNGFGATVRSDYRCRYEPESDALMVTSLETR